MGNEFEAYYLRQLEIVHRVEVFTLDLNCAHLESTRSTWNLYKQLKQCPQEILLIMDQGGPASLSILFIVPLS